MNSARSRAMHTHSAFDRPAQRRHAPQVVLRGAPHRPAWGPGWRSRRSCAAAALSWPLGARPPLLAPPADLLPRRAPHRAPGAPRLARQARRPPARLSRQRQAAVRARQGAAQRALQARRGRLVAASALPTPERAQALGQQVRARLPSAALVRTPALQLRRDGLLILQGALAQLLPSMGVPQQAAAHQAAASRAAWRTRHRTGRLGAL